MSAVPKEKPPEVRTKTQYGLRPGAQVEPKLFPRSLEGASNNVILFVISTGFSLARSSFPYDAIYNLLPPPLPLIPRFWHSHVHTYERNFWAESRPQT